MKAFIIAATMSMAASASVTQAASITQSTTIATHYDSSTFNAEPDYTYEGGIDTGGYAGNTTRGEKARDYLQFSLGSFGSGKQIASAFLNLSYCCDYMGVGALNLYATSDDWHGSSITWRNQPDLGDLLLTFAPVEPGVYSLDITDFVTAEYMGDGIVSLVIAGGDSNSWRYFNGGEQTLTVNAASIAVPEPGELSLFGLGLLGLFALRRKAHLQ